ncbi:MAG: methyltransferase domain-containing protein [Planctomycetes bacterium]|nr:methyltransferase domain-containing protein [Planctomycetota bacterium]
MKSIDLIRIEERRDWDTNASFYRRDERSPLMRLLAVQRQCFYGVRPGQRVLDLGCGAGGAVAELRARGVDALGIDSSPAMIKAASQAHQLGEYVSCADAADLPFDSNSFDTVIADGILHHLAVQGRLGDALREINRVLIPGGTLCCFDRNGSLVSGALLRLSIGVKELIRRASSGVRYPSSATRNEIPFGGHKDMDSIRRAGFTIKRRRSVATAPFFMSVVMLNSIQYFLSQRLRKILESVICRIMVGFEAQCAWHWFSVEQLAVFEAKPRRTPDGERAWYTGARGAPALISPSPALL